MPIVYREQPADARLAHWVECSWTSQSDVAVHGYPVRPDGCLDVIWARGTGAQIVGAMTSERCFDLAPGARAFGIRFRPGMAGPFLAIPPAELTDATIALEDAWGKAARAVERQLDDAPSLSAAVRVMTGALMSPHAAPDAVQLAIAAIASAHGDIDLAWVARQAGLSERQFRRRCLEASGLAPKQLCRVLRFRRACALAHPAADWAAIAATAGYFDQSHLIRDFREFTGRAPMSVFSNTAAAVIR